MQYGLANLPYPPANCYDLHNRTETVNKKNFVVEAGEESNIIGPLPHTLWISEQNAITITNLVTSKALQQDKDILLRALSAVTITAQGRMPNIHTNKIKCVDMHLFMKLLLHTYRADQVNRRAVFRLMFETAASNRLSDEALLYAQEKGFGRKLTRSKTGGSGGAAGASFYQMDNDGDEDDEVRHQTMQNTSKYFKTQLTPHNSSRPRLLPPWIPSSSVPSSNLSHPQYPSMKFPHCSEKRTKTTISR